MNARFVACPRIASAVSFGRPVVLIALMLAVIDGAQAVQISVGNREVIYTSSQRKSKSLSTWPDGNLGVVSNGLGGYEFYGANGSKPVKTTGTLTDPGKSKKSVKITGLPKKTFNYVAGGPVYRDEATGARVMIYHAEKHGKSAKDFYSVLGMAVSTDASGLTFRDLGTIVEPNLPTGQTEVGGGSFAVLDSYFNVYYRDWFPDGSRSELAVARAPVTDLINNALGGLATPFTKYYNGSWSQPGRGGLASPLEIGNPPNSWSAVSYNDYLDGLVMVSSQWEPGAGNLYMATSQDGVNWSGRQPVVLDAGEQFYPSMIGTGPDPTVTGKSFYVYYTDSQKGAWSRWSDAQLVRRAITLDPLAPSVVPPVIPPVVPPVIPPEVPPLNWAQISDYQSDFQSGVPATGWKYAWNPTGALGNAAAFTPLLWSNVAQAYNTTGAATPVPASKTHIDDYLSLTATGGHPGRPKYLPIAGYTIQADDGAGLYRLADSSIRKIDSLLSSSEDGLQVLVYVNNTLFGSAQSVSTSGQLASFNRELGQLNVGDTIWVMVDPLKNQLYDSFTGFDFAIQKAIPMVQLGIGGAVPEPSTAVLLLMALAGYRLRRPARS